MRIYKFILLLLMVQKSSCYDLPLLNVGLTNILDGGPIRPTSGWYFYQYAQYYSANKFKDKCGNLLACPSPSTKSWYGITEVVYQSKDDILLHAQAGVDIALPYAFSSCIGPNKIGLTDTGRGMGDPFIGLFLQWHPIMKGDRTIFVHRLEFAASFPAGKYIAGNLKNPGNGCYFLNPYWAATLYFTPKWAASWRLQYIWPAKNKHIDLQAGQAVLLNYSMEYEIIKNFWIAVNGYWLDEFTDSIVRGVKTPGRRDRVVSVGPGCVYTYKDNLFLFFHAYFEKKARNQTQGLNVVTSAVLHF